MKQKIWKVLSYVLVALAACALTLGATFLFSIRSNKLTQLEFYLRQYYVDGVDEKALEDAAAQGMVSALGDRWSYYIPADQYQSYEENKNNAYVGIGVTVQAEDRGYLVIQVSEGGPALEAGITSGDVIIRADGKNLADMPEEERSACLKGQEDSQVAVTVLRNNQELTFTVTRRSIKVPVATGKLLEGNVGYVKIRNFNTSCYQETRGVVESLIGQGATSILFDVRNNGGGYAKEMIRLLDYLLPEGPLFRTEDYSGKTQVEVSDASFLDLPMGVLVNENSYSAAEFFAAALSEYDAAIVVGQKTSGKGYFQNTFQLVDGSAVAISTGKYCTPNGVSLEGVGITPDIAVSVTEAEFAQIYAGTLDAAQDPQIIAAINALKSAK